MNDWALYLGAAAALCTACSLMGAGFAHLWGVDPSRETSGTHQRHAAARRFSGQLQCFLAALPASLWLGAEAGQRFGALGGALVSAAYALGCAMLGFMAMFVSVRHDGQDMAQVCEEELFDGAEKIRHALGCAACVLGAGAMLMSLLKDGFVVVTNAHLLVFSCALWPMLSMQTAASRIAPSIANEREMLPAAACSAVCAGLFALLMLLPGASLTMRWEMTLVLGIGVALVWIAAWTVLVRLGGKELYGLLKRPFSMKKQRAWPKTLLCAAISIVLALAGGAWLFVAAAALCAGTAAMDIVACTTWLRRIGRSLFSRN